MQIESLQLVGSAVHRAVLNTMAARSSIRTLVSALSGTSRSVHTSPIILAATQNATPSSSSSSSSGSSAFARLGSISSAASSSSSPFLPFVPAADASAGILPGDIQGRGYQPKVVPPKVDPLLELFTNLIMKHGRKAEAQTRTQLILSHIQRAANAPPLPLLAQAVELSSPTIRLLSMRKRAKRVETPRALNEKQRTRQGIIWLLKAAERGRKAGVPRDQRIAREVFSVLEGTSDVFKWLEERHRSAAANRSNVGPR